MDCQRPPCSARAERAHLLPQRFLLKKTAERTVPKLHQGFHGMRVANALFLHLFGSQSWVNPEKFRIDCFQYWNS